MKIETAGGDGTRYETEFQILLWEPNPKSYNKFCVETKLR